MISANDIAKVIDMPRISSKLNLFKLLILIEFSLESVSTEVVKY